MFGFYYSWDSIAAQIIAKEATQDLTVDVLAENGIESKSASEVEMEDEEQDPDELVTLNKRGH